MAAKNEWQFEKVPCYFFLAVNARKRRSFTSSSRYFFFSETSSSSSLQDGWYRLKKLADQPENLQAHIPANQVVQNLQNLDVNMDIQAIQVQRSASIGIGRGQV